MPRKPKILIVEDRVQDMNLTIRSITKAGYDVDIVKARHGVEAIEILERADDRRPDLVLLDWMLPLKSGDEVLAHIRGCPRLRTVPVIVLTTSRDEDDHRLRGADESGEKGEKHAASANSSAPQKANLEGLASGGFDGVFDRIIVGLPVADIFGLLLTSLTFRSAS